MQHSAIAVMHRPRADVAGGALDDRAVRAVAGDNRTDKLLTAIRDIARAQAEGLSADHPTRDQVARFLDAVFPHGVLAVMSLPYFDQALAVETVVGILQGEMAATASQLGLETRVQQLVEMTAAYRGLVNAGRDDMRATKAMTTWPTWTAPQPAASATATSSRRCARRAEQD